MTYGQDDGLPFGMRPGVNDNLMQPSFRDGPHAEPRKRAWPFAFIAVLAILAIALLIGYSVLS